MFLLLVRLGQRSRNRYDRLRLRLHERRTTATTPLSLLNLLVLEVGGGVLFVDARRGMKRSGSDGRRRDHYHLRHCLGSSHALTTAIIARHRQLLLLLLLLLLVDELLLLLLLLLNGDLLLLRLYRRLLLYEFLMSFWKENREERRRDYEDDFDYDVGLHLLSFKNDLGVIGYLFAHLVLLQLLLTTLFSRHRRRGRHLGLGLRLRLRLRLGLRTIDLLLLLLN